MTIVPPFSISFSVGMGRSHDKIRPQYVRRKDTKDTIRRYIVLLPEEKADSCKRDS